MSKLFKILIGLIIIYLIIGFVVYMTDANYYRFLNTDSGIIETLGRVILWPISVFLRFAPPSNSIG